MGNAIGWDAYSVPVLYCWTWDGTVCLPHFLPDERFGGYESLGLNPTGTLRRQQLTRWCCHGTSTRLCEVESLSSFAVCLLK